MRSRTFLTSRDENSVRAIDQLNLELFSYASLSIGAGITTDYDLVKKLLTQMSDLLGESFLHIDFSAPPRDVQNTDWSHVTSCRRSER